MQEILKTEILWYEETSDSLVLILEKKATLSEDAVKTVEMEIGKKIFLLREGDEKGLLASLEGPSGKMLGVGTVHGVDFRNMTIKICTPVKGAVSRIRVGQIKLDTDGNEKGILFEDSRYSLKDIDD